MLKANFRRLSILCTAMFLVLDAHIAQAQVDSQPAYKPSLEVKRVTLSVKIDGDLSDPGWAQAARTDQFVETDPGDQIPPGVKSATLIGYDDANLYLAFIAWDNPKQIRATFCERDNIWNDDYFGIMLDTYGDRSGGYEIFVNPYGMQGDVRVTNSSGNEDESHNLIFYSAGRVTDSGYQVEVAVPFSSLRFPNIDVQTWRAQFWRDRQRETRYRYAWAPVNRNDPCWICQWGTLTGIRGIKPATNIEVLPSIVGHQSGALRVQPTAPQFDFSNENPDAEFSAALRVSPTSSSTAEVTVNPDFSQVESDPGQVDVNTTFALFFQERRPFFQEGNELYQTPITAVYTRSINDPIVAAKFTGRFGRTSVAYSIARDDHSPFLLPSFGGSATFLAGKSTVNLFRAQTALGNGSSIGLIGTDRRLDGGGSGTVIGGDGSLRFLKNWQFRFQTLLSHTAESSDSLLTDSMGLEGVTFDRGRHTMVFDGESYSGHASSVRLSRSSRRWDLEASYQSFRPTFRADNGFVFKNDFQQWNFWSGLTFRQAKGLILNFSPQFSVGGVLKADKSPFDWSLDELLDSWINPHIYINAIRQTDINLDYVYSREVFRGKEFAGISRGQMNWNTRVSSALSVGWFVSYGRVIARNLDDP
ncbi:MAG: carbohydrate binding family 9 domain-containing protein, partial [candidate division Zixibacteria bacterium]|nr:carbohydrate binding family 9 domain-containing protein [candidate division Zixibacteria bacterium]